MNAEKQHTQGSFDRLVAGIAARDKREAERAERRRLLELWRVSKGIYNHPDDGPISAFLASDKVLP